MLTMTRSHGRSGKSCDESESIRVLAFQLVLKVLCVGFQQQFHILRFLNIPRPCRYTHHAEEVGIVGDIPIGDNALSATVNCIFKCAQESTVNWLNFALYSSGRIILLNIRSFRQTLCCWSGERIRPKPTEKRNENKRQHNERHGSYRGARASRICWARRVHQPRLVAFVGTHITSDSSYSKYNAAHCPPRRHRSHRIMLGRHGL